MLWLVFEIERRTEAKGRKWEGSKKMWSRGNWISHKDDADTEEQKREVDREEGVQERGRAGSPSILIPDQ